MTVWLVLSGLTHGSWELGWCLVSRSLGAQTSSGWLRIWWLYGVADRRYLHADPFVLTLELVTGTLCSSLNFYAAYQLLKGRTRRALPALLVVSVMEVYGAVLYMGSELFNGLGNINTASAVDTWGKFFGLNLIWVIVPGLCIVEAIQKLGHPAPPALPVLAERAV